jgi:GNAT superfamily N-acetyltransferase
MRLEDVVQRLVANLHKDRIPVQVIALDADRVVGLGSAQAARTPRGVPSAANWLGSVFVTLDARGKGVATALCARVIDLALEFGLSALHLQTQDTTGGLYARLGWQTIDRTVSEGRDTLIMKKKLPSSLKDAAQAV